MDVFCMIVPRSEYLWDPWAIEPLGSLYLATVAWQYVDMSYIRVWGEEQLPPLNSDADEILFGITVVTPHYEQTRNIMDTLRRWYPKCKIVLGGAHCTFLPKETMQDLKPDFLVAGEGEIALTRILNDVYEDAPGIYYEDKGGSIAEAPNLEYLPIPDHSLLLHDYVPNPAFSSDPGGVIMASRGCPYGCSYCGPSVGRKVRWRKAWNVAREMELFSQWRFEDDDIFGNHEWFRVFAKYAKGKAEWRGSARGKSVTPEILELAKSTGCRQIGIGVETANPELLKRHCPSKSVEANTAAIEMINEAGLYSTAFLIAGLPGETEQSIQDTIDWIEEVKPDKFTVSACTPYPGSRLWSDPDRYGILNMCMDYSEYIQLGHEDDDVAFVYDTEQLDRKELTRLWHKLRKVAQYGLAPKQ